MEKFQGVLLHVWREACRHIEIERSAETLGNILAKHFPISQLLVRRLDVAQQSLETVASHHWDSRPTQHPHRNAGTPAEIERLVHWAKEGRIARVDRQNVTPPHLYLATPWKCRQEFMVVPLLSDGEPTGLLVLVGAPGHPFTDRHDALAEALVEPFSSALENDRRLRETATLREAAEADKRSLLARLGRKALGDPIVGTDAGLRLVLERVELVAPSDAPVLLLGETGTGKELVARTIHARSHRAQKPFIRVNCGAIPPELIDSQLFGHERGAFTGAVERRRGWFERADEGTLFLDEIGELPPAAQVRLLRILHDGSMERVGGERPIQVDVRIVAATHCDLATMVGEETFRGDLWYRLAVFPVQLPPLRDRLGDVPALAEHFALRAATRFGLAETMPTEADLELLASYSWPGNIRELAAVIDRAAILGNGRRLDISTALGVPSPSPIHPAEPPPATAPVSADPGLAIGKRLPPKRLPNDDLHPLGDSRLDTVLRHHFRAVLAATAGQISGRHGAAQLLNLHPNTLRSRLEKLGIDWRQYREE